MLRPRPPPPLFTLRAGLTQSQTGVQGALGLLCSGGRAYTAWAGLVSFLVFFLLRMHYLKNISREHYVSSWDANIVIPIKILYIVQPYFSGHGLQQEY